MALVDLLLNLIGLVLLLAWRTAGRPATVRGAGTLLSNLKPAESRPTKRWGYLLALAGVLAGPFLSVQPSMHLLPIVKAFAIVIVGGLGSIPGSILAALMLGYAETLVAYLVSTSWTEIVSVLATLLMLVFRPAGFFGKRAAF